MRMYSGPGHDAQFAADLVPATMIFVPSEGGHSHCELEYTPTENCKKGADGLLNTILKIDSAIDWQNALSWNANQVCGIETPYVKKLSQAL